MSLILVAEAPADPFLDNFDGTGAIGSPWTLFNDKNTTPVRSGGYFYHALNEGDNGAGTSPVVSANSSAFFRDTTLYVGTAVYVNIARPASGTRYLYAIGLGVAPLGDPGSNLTQDGHTYSFGKMGAWNNLVVGTTIEGEFAAPCFRNGVATIELKRWLSGQQSTQTDIGSRGSLTKANIRCGYPSSGGLTWAYQPEGSDPLVDSWTDLTASFTGTAVTPGATMAFSLAGYSFNGSISASEAFAAVCERTFSVLELP